MEPVLQRLGDVTIQRLEKPKDTKVEPPPSNNLPLGELKHREENDNSDEFFPSEDESGEDFDEHEDDDFQPPVTKTLPLPPQDLKRGLPISPLKLGPEISFKKFKPDVPDKPVEKPIRNPSQGQKKFEDENEPSCSDDEMSYYDSDLESEGELQDLGNDLGLSLGLGDALKPAESKSEVNATPSPILPANLPSSTTIPIFPAGKQQQEQIFPSNAAVPGFSKTASESVKEEGDEGSDGTSFFEKLVEQADVPPPAPSTPSVKTESPDEDYEIDIKEKLKEMGEITFASVKKGDKPKSSDTAAENEVVITKKSGEEVTVMSKGNLRRNIREVMDETKLDETTLAAQRQEAERLKRVQEQQRILREYQRQAQQERMQQRVMSLLQGNNFPKPGPSNQTRIGNTVLVKLPNGQTKPMTKVPRPPFDLLKMPKPEVPHSRHPPHHGPMGPMGPLGPMSAPRGYPRGPPMPHRRGPGVHLPASLSFAPVSKRGPPLLPIKPHQSDSDSENEEKKGLLSHLSKSHRGRRGKSSDNQTIEVSSDDDCIVVSESEADQGPDDDDDQDDPSNSGMHTNDEFNQPDEQGRVLVNVGHGEDEPDVFVAPQIAKIIKPHQIGGVRFLYDNIVESINRFDSSTGFGCILAHSMGLGKTLQIVTFSDVFLRYTPAKTVLCIMPINTLQNWMAEYNMWTPTAEAAANSPLNAHGEVRPRNFNLHVLNDAHKTIVARQKVVHAWSSHGGVLLIGYEQFRLLTMKKNSKTRRKGMQAPDLPEDDKNKIIFDEIYTALVDPGPDLVICDEGHRIKNSHASISAALKQLRTKRRVVLTGYPLQNNLTEYWCMVDFVRPNYLGSKTEFLNMFERPIMNGQCIDSTEADIRLMRYRAHVLHSLLVGFVQRRSHTVLQTVLPQKEEYVLLVRLTPFQRKLYDTFMNEVVRNQAVPNPLKAFAVCCKIWNHPDVLYNFLVKKTRGDAVDLDLEEVASTVSGVSTSTEAKPKRGPGKPRKTPAKGRNSKPAASVTPYNSNNDSLLNSMQPPASATNGLPSQTTTTQSQFNSITGSFSNAHKSQETNYGPYTDEFNQPRTSFEGISQFFDDHMSQSSYDTHFDDNAQFSPFPSPNSNLSQQSQGNFQQKNSHFSEQPSSTQTSLFNLDNQNTVSVSNTNVPKSISNIPNLPSGISLTPLGSKSQNTSALTGPHPRSPSSLDLMDVGTPANVDHYSIPNSQFEQNSRNTQFPPQNSQFLMRNNSNRTSTDFGFQENFEQQNCWDPEKKPEFNTNPSTFNSATNITIPNNPPPWLKKEENSPIMTPNHLASPQKSESSNESSRKIKIISDIKLPPVFLAEKKINIISDIKIEPKKEEKDDDKFNVKRELEKIKNELKTELKIEDEPKPVINENPLAKLASLPPPKDSKEDSGIPYDWAIELLKDYVPGRIENSAKFQILFCIIKESLALGDRLLVFSQSLITLDLIEQFLQSSEIPGQSYKWAKNTSYYRLDGSTGPQEREKLINEFNSNPKIYLFLVSTRAGSLGINLIGANRVVVLDASWNPCHDTQAVCRVYRYGQRKPCFIYRLVVDNCLEKKIYDRQVSKQGMSDRVVDECNPDAHLTIKDVSTLCFDDKKDEGEIKDWSFCKDNYIDVVLQKVLNLHGTTLTKEPFQHESLLVDRKEKQLSQQEKRLAKKGYEREKNAARQPAYLSGAGRGHRPVASVRPMQQGGERPSRWIPAEHWQRQGMTAQEMTLPLDVVIPTNQPEKGNIVLKAGQKVLVLKSPKGVYMQLESGKIVAIKTAIKVKGKADENSSDPMKLGGKPPLMPPQMKNNPSLSVIPQKRPQKPPPPLPQSPQMPLIPGMTKFNVKSVQKMVPNLVSKIHSVSKKAQSMPAKPKPFQVGNEIAKQLREGEAIPGSSSEDEHMAPPMDKPRLPPPPPPSQPASVDEGADELEKKISQLKKNISIQRVTSGGVKQPLKSTPPSQPSPISQPQPQQKLPQKESHPHSKISPQKTAPQDKQPKARPGDSILDRLGQSTSLLENTPFQETLDSITAGFKNPDNLRHLDSDEEEEDEGRPPLEDDDPEDEEEHEGAMSDSSIDQNKEADVEDPEDPTDQNEASDQDDEVTYVDQQSEPTNQQSDGSAEYASSATGGYNYNYNYNMPPYQGHPPPQGYGYPPQHPPPYDSYGTYSHGQPPYNYGYQGYPPHQPHYPPPPPQPGYDYSNTPQHVYPSYPYQQYPPPQGIYPPPPAPAAPPSSYPEYSQYPNQSQSSTSTYYQNT